MVVHDDRTRHNSAHRRHGKPSAGSTGVAIGGNPTATYSEEVQPSTISFVLTDASNNVVPAIVSYDPRTDVVTLDPDANLLPGTTYTATLSGALDLAGNAMSSMQWSFTTAPAFDITAPTVISMSPASGATGVAILANVTATFSEEVQANTISLVLIDANDNAVPAAVTYDPTTETVTLDPNANLSPATTYTATLSAAQDLSGNVLTTLSWSFTTAPSFDSTPPALVSQGPTAGSSGVTITSNVTATLSEQVQASTISFVLTDASHTQVPATVSYNPATLTVTLHPDATLLPSTTYSATLAGPSRPLRQRAGNGIMVVYDGRCSEYNAALGVFTNSGSRHTGVAVGSDVTATFSEEIQASTVNFSLTDASNNTVPAVVTFDPTTLTVTLDPSTNLAAGATYTATLSGAQDLAGSVMAPVTWSFTTLAGDRTAPTISAQSPAAGATGVLITSPVTASFSKTVVPSTISFVLKNGSTTVAATVTYDVSSRIVTLDPTANLTPGATYTATLSGDQDLSGNTMSPVSWSFTAVAANTTAPTVSSQSPASGVTGVLVASNLTATFSENVQPSTISFVLKTGSTTVSSTTTYDVSSRVVTLDPNSNLSPGTTYTATLSGAKDLWGNTMTSTSWSFTTAAADTTAPTISTRTPASGATGVLIASTVSATFSEDVQPGTISFVLKTGSTTVSTAVTYDVTTRTVTLDPNSNLASGTTYTATLSGAQDLSGNTMSSSSWSFTTVPAIAGPTVSAQSPASGATAVVVASNVTATFSEDVQPSTISFVLKTGSITVPAAVTYDIASRVVTLDPNANLTPGTNYTATLSGAQDLSGNTMSSTSWAFTTVAADSAPTASSLSPASNATAVVVASNVTATFSEAVIPSTISFVLKTGSTTVSSTVTYDVASRVVTLDPNSNLSPGTIYTATLSGAQDLSGNTMVSTSWSFTTATADTTAPTVSGQTPANSATSVPVDSVVKATFSEAIQLGTLSFVLKTGSTTISSTVSYDPTTNMVSLTPNSNLATSTNYTATLSGAQDRSGNVMSTVTWSFTTAGTLATPGVSSQSPAPNAILFPVANSLTATFNTSMSSSSFTTSTFFLKDSSGNTISSSVSYSTFNNTATLNPNSNLTAGTTYTATLSGVRSSGGTTMATTTWSFTAGTADTTAPTASSQTPANNATGVPIASNVTATFSADVQASTISFVLKAGSTTIPTVTSYDVASRVVTLDPSSNLTPGTTYTATLSGAKDLSGNTMTSTSWSFTTAAVDTAPTASSLSPASGVSGVVIASNVTATFSKDVIPSTISFVLKAGSTTVPAAVTYDVTSRIVTLDPTANLTPGTTYTATLSGAQDVAGTTMTSTSWSFTTATANTTGPVISSQTPTSGATGVLIASNVSATLSESVIPSTISFVLKNGSTTVGSAITYDVASRTVTLDPTANLAVGTTYSATLSGAQDVSGNTMSPVSWSFTTVAADIAPTVSAQTPASAATGVLLASNVTATLSESVIPSTISFVLKNGSTTVGSAITYDVASHTVTLDPTANLAAGTTYTATLSGATDLAGNAVTSTSWSFTTVTVNTTTPTVSTQSPGSGASGVPIVSRVTATFSESVIPGTISFVLKNGSTTLPAAVTYDVASQTVTLDPTANLAPGTTYTATLSGAQDLWGNTMASTSWSFTTEAANTTAPVVTAQTPVSGATGVAAGSNVTATFSEDVLASTISFVLKNGSSPVSAAVTYDPISRTVTLDPNVNLAQSTTYTATLSAAQDLYGNVMSTLSWTFTTAAGDTTAPTLISETPAPATSGIAITTLVTATFSEDVQASTISFTLQNGSTIVPGTVSYDSPSRTVTLGPGTNLVPGTSYTAILSGAQDLSGNVMAPVSWTFTTAVASTNTTPPSVVATESGFRCDGNRSRHRLDGDVQRGCPGKHD